MRNFYDIFLFFSWQKLPSASKNPTQDTFVFFDRCFFPARVILLDAHLHTGILLKSRTQDK